MTRHGLALSGGSLAVVLSQNTASAGVPTSLISSTIKAASYLAAGQALTTGLVSAKVAALTEGVVKAMLLNKLKMTLVSVAVIGVIGTGLGGLSFRAAASDKLGVQTGQQQVAQADVKQAKTVQPEKDKGNDPGNKADEKKSQEKNQAKQALDQYKEAFLKAFQISSEIAKEKSYRQPDGKQAGPADKAASDLYAEAFLKAFQISSEIAKAHGKIAPDDKKPPLDQELAKLLWEMMEKSYRHPEGKEAGPADKEMLDQYREAFFKAFQISSEIAKSRDKGHVMAKPHDEAVFDAYGPAFVQAYERARTLKKTLEDRKASGGKESQKAIEALDVFLKAGKEFEQTVKQYAKTQAVQEARREIENAVTKVENSTHDRRTELETLEEIEKAVQQMKKKLQETRDGK
jgi:hypothetical protein